MGNSKSQPRHHLHSPSNLTDLDSFAASKQVKSRRTYPHSERLDAHRRSAPVLGSGVYPHESPVSGDPIKFHDTHGVNIAVTEDGQVASRTNSFCYAIAFTSRPINIEERIHLNLKTVETGWSGVMRFGFTSNDPATLEPNDLPRYACPDLTNQPGYWAKAVPEQFAKQDNVLSFYVNHSGSVFYYVNDNLEGVFLGDVDVSLPLWGIVDIYGNTTSLQLVDNYSSTGLRPFSSASILNYGETGMSSRWRVSLPPDMSSEVKRLFSVTQPITHIGFSATMGKQLKSRNRKLMTRTENEWESTLAFSNTPLKPGESVYMYCACAEAFQHTAMAEMAFGIGITTCDPSKIHVSELPVDSSAILDRPEYWIIYKEFDPPDEKEYFKLTIEPSGCLTYARQNKQPAALFHMDVSQPLYLVFDLCSDVRSLAIIGMSSAAEETDPSEDYMQELDHVMFHDNDDMAFSLNHMNTNSFFNVGLGNIGENAIVLPSRPAASSSDDNERTAVFMAGRTSSASESDVGLSMSGSEVSQSSPGGQALDTEETRQEVQVQAAPAPEDSLTVRDVAAMSAPFVMSALSWLGSTMANRLRSNSHENVEGAADRDQAMDSDSSSSSGDSGRVVGWHEADAAENDDFFNARDGADGSADSSDDQSLENNFEINSRLLDMLNADLNELLRPLELDVEPGGATGVASAGMDALPNNAPAAVECNPLGLKEGDSIPTDKECVVCCDSPVNAVVYTCGHACMCYQCGQIILRQPTPTCPICRARVKDIIRIYQA